MDLIHQSAAAYLDALVPERPDELRRMEAEAEKTGFPIVGPASGQFCYFVAKLIGARRIFELGSGYGYSTAWFARAVKENGGGSVHHVVWDEDLSARARGHLTALGLDDVVTYTVGEAVSVLERTEGPFDIIFNDIDKAGYPAALTAAAPKLREGGVMITDNALWSGRVLDDADESDATSGIRELTRRLTTDPMWTTTLVPVRDGLLVAMKGAPAG